MKKTYPPEVVGALLLAIGLNAGLTLLGWLGFQLEETLYIAVTVLSILCVLTVQYFMQGEEG